MQHRSKQVLRLALLAAAGAALMGCQSIRDASGLSKSAPDEFAVVTKAPLIIPPEYNLRPPRDGAPPTNQVPPTDAAQSALFESDPAAAAKLIPGDYSEGEKVLLAYAHAVNPDPGIRQQIAADGRAMETSDDSFASQVLFWQAPKTDTGTSVNAEAEDKRLAGQKAAGQVAAQPAAAQPAAADTADKKPPTDSATIDSQDSQDSKGGWFDGIF